MIIREQLDSIAEKRILILDGAMGSLIQTVNLDEKGFRGSLFENHSVPLIGCNDVLCLTRPGVIGAIHDTYLEAGADIIETCSFNSTSISLSNYGLSGKAYEICAASAEIARKSTEKFSTVDKPRFVAGSIGPTAKGASLYPDINNPSKRSITWDELESAYYDSARGLLDGGIDIFLVETIFDTLNAKAALFAISRLLEERQVDVPVMISAAISNEAGKLLSGQSLSAFCTSMLNMSPLCVPWSIGLNCSFNAARLLPFVRELSASVPCFVSVYPNAGLPDQFGHYEENPEAMSANIREYFDEKLVNIVGGCCGSTPAHIAEIAEAAENFKPRQIFGNSRRFVFSGLETLYIYGNRINLSAKNTADMECLNKALADGDYEDAADTAQNIIEDGLQILSIETDSAEAVSKFLDFALMNPYIAKAPFFINSSCPDVLETALKRFQGRGLAGPLDIIDGEDEFLRKVRLIHRYGAVAVVSLTGGGEIETAESVCQLLRKNNYPIENIAFKTSDPDNFDSWVRDNCLEVFIAI